MERFEREIIALEKFFKDLTTIGVIDADVDQVAKLVARKYTVQNYYHRVMVKTQNYGNI